MKLKLKYQPWKVNIYINSNWYLLLTPSSLKVANFRKAYGGGGDGGCDII